LMELSGYLSFLNWYTTNKKLLLQLCCVCGCCPNLIKPNYMLNRAKKSINFEGSSELAVVKPQIQT
jgi:hypothetical protein